MAKIFAKNLSKKNVMSSDGSVIGVLYNIVMDVQTGKLVNLVVKPDMSVDKSRYQMEGNYILIGFSAVRAVRDFIVVDKKEAMA
ncbi:MAG: PRC-barrel domain-containing protein [Methanosarcinales archaeon]|nr:PRC-barrel domain-containing protein [Methanosarcinales archaeon]MCK4652720.1 PRC-barrel domain-containing protein [Methanosarcinales archaeon]MCK4811924.1 PRC-barrel domain-containing protein [Methanosarcinales archaeon]